MQTLTVDVLRLQSRLMVKVVIEDRTNAGEAPERAASGKASVRTLMEP